MSKISGLNHYVSEPGERFCSVETYRDESKYESSKEAEKFFSEIHPETAGYCAKDQGSNFIASDYEKIHYYSEPESEPEYVDSSGDEIDEDEDEFDEDEFEEDEFDI